MIEKIKWQRIFVGQSSPEAKAERKFEVIWYFFIMPNYPVLIAFLTHIYLIKSSRKPSGHVTLYQRMFLVDNTSLRWQRKFNVYSTLKLWRQFNITFRRWNNVEHWFFHNIISIIDIFHIASTTLFQRCEWNVETTL